MEPSSALAHLLGIGFGFNSSGVQGGAAEILVVLRDDVFLGFGHHEISQERLSLRVENPPGIRPTEHFALAQPGQLFGPAISGVLAVSMLTARTMPICTVVNPLCVPGSGGKGHPAVDTAWRTSNACWAYRGQARTT